MHITDYEKVNSLEDNDVFLIDGDRGTKTITGSKLKSSLFQSPEFGGGLTTR